MAPNNIWRVCGASEKDTIPCHDDGIFAILSQTVPRDVTFRRANQPTKQQLIEPTTFSVLV